MRDGIASRPIPAAELPSSRLRVMEFWMNEDAVPLMAYP